jgi:outer membrane protein OmpU
MNNLKKIGLTALAGSLVATSVFAGTMNVTGGASFEVQHVNGAAANTGKAFSQSNHINFNGGSTLDNGLDIAVHLELDNGAENGGGPFDSHSIKVGTDSMGTLTFSGHGGSSAQVAVDDTVTGDLWDNGLLGANAAVKNSGSSNNMLSYSAPSVIDGLSLNASYVPNSESTATGEHESSTSWAVAFTGVEGLTVGYAAGDQNDVSGAHGDAKTMYAKYAMGPITVGYTATEYTSELDTVAGDQDYTGMQIGYTVSDNISVTYGTVKIESKDVTDDEDVKVSGFTASYTSGGMTLSGKMISADNTNHTTDALEDKDMWELAASFAF